MINSSSSRAGETLPVAILASIMGIVFLVSLVAGYPIMKPGFYTLEQLEAIHFKKEISFYLFLGMLGGFLFAFFLENPKVKLLISTLSFGIFGTVVIGFCKGPVWLFLSLLVVSVLAILPLNDKANLTSKPFDLPPTLEDKVGLGTLPTEPSA